MFSFIFFVLCIFCREIQSVSVFVSIITIIAWKFQRSFNKDILSWDIHLMIFLITTKYYCCWLFFPSFRFIFVSIFWMWFFWNWGFDRFHLCFYTQKHHIEQRKNLLFFYCSLFFSSSHGDLNETPDIVSICKICWKLIFFSFPFISSVYRVSIR